MARPRKFTDAQIEAALRSTGGFYSHAAAWLEQTTGQPCHRETIARNVQRSKRLQAVQAEIQETILDVAESNLMKAIREGNLTAIIYYTKTKGRHRGYVERKETTGPDGGAVPIEAKVDVSGLEKLSREDLRLYLELSEKAAAASDES